MIPPAAGLTSPGLGRQSTLEICSRLSTLGVGGNGVLATIRAHGSHILGLPSGYLT